MIAAIRAGAGFLLIIGVLCSTVSVGAQQLIGNGLEGPICLGPTGAASCTAVLKYLREHPDAATAPPSKLRLNDLTAVGSEAQQLGARCARLSVGKSDAFDVFISCTEQQIVLRWSQQLLVDCAGKSGGDESTFTLCASAIPVAATEQHLLFGCLGKESTTVTSASCAATQLTAYELRRCLIDGIGGARGCFSVDVGTAQHDDWTARPFIAAVINLSNNFVPNISVGPIFPGPSDFPSSTLGPPEKRPSTITPPSDGPYNSVWPKSSSTGITFKCATWIKCEDTGQSKYRGLQPVFFATNRKIAEGSSFSLASILSVPSSELTYGLAIVSVPKNHRIGHVERPTSRFFGLIQQRGSDEDDFRIQTLSALSREALVDMLRRNPDSLLLFIHGYNVSFDAAVFKAAQIAYDASFEGSVMVFSWPSTGNLAAYDHDYQSALASPEALVSVLKLISAKVGTKKIFVVAHSLGNQILVDSLQQAALAHVNLNISELVLAAPDVDTNVFLAKASQIEAVSRHVTIYASSADKALLASGLKTLGLRLGYIGSQGPTLVSGIETIDVTAVGDDIFGLNHSAFSESAIALDDLGRIIDSGTHPPEVRTPILQSMPNRTDVKYWMFPK